MQYFLDELKQHLEQGRISPSLGLVLRDFTPTYLQAVQATGEQEKVYEEILLQYLVKVEEQVAHPYVFSPYHQAVRKPFDYRAFGLNFLRPLIDLSLSSLGGKEHVWQMERQLAQGDNVIWLANHQTEPDPQAIALLLDDVSRKLSEQVIFVAGHRVTSDPLAVPLSLGCNLLCIFSKKHIDHPKEQREEKMRHNRRTMQKMAELLDQGGTCIYVAPSGGRDRKNAQGIVEVAPFDPQSIEMFRLMAEQASRPTHFYPLALSTFSLLPPPQSVEQELGEERRASRTAVHLLFGEEIEWEALFVPSPVDKKEKRRIQGESIWKIVCRLYQEIDR